MATVDTSKRLREVVVQENIKSLQNARQLSDYIPLRPESKLETLNDLEEKMRLAQEAEVQAKAQYRAASDAAQKLEWEFHNSILSLKKNVLAQYGDDSNEAESVGYTKKSDRKRPQRSNSSKPEES